MKIITLGIICASVIFSVGWYVGRVTVPPEKRAVTKYRNVCIEPQIIFWDGIDINPCFERVINP